jgi:hypothetical protein
VFDNGHNEPSLIEREDGSGKVLAGAEAYMLFRAGVEPKTEFEYAPGRRSTLMRFRAEVSVREWERERAERQERGRGAECSAYL